MQRRPFRAAVTNSLLARTPRSIAYASTAQVIDGVLGNSRMTQRQEMECRANGIDSEAIIKETEKNKIPWLQNLMVFCNNVSVVGLRYVTNTSASAYRRSIWFLLILVGALFTTYQIQDRIRYYLRYPVNVNVWQEYLEEMTFPTVTICNENRASLSKMTSLGWYRPNNNTVSVTFSNNFCTLRAGFVKFVRFLRSNHAPKAVV